MSKICIKLSHSVKLSAAAILLVSISPLLPSAWGQVAADSAASQTAPAISAEPGKTSGQVINAQAQAHFQELQLRLEKAQRKHNGADEADALYDLAVAHYNERDLSGAEQYGRQAIAREDQLSRPESSVQARQILASIFQAQKRADDAEQMFHLALDKAQSASLWEKCIDLMLCLGQLSASKQDLAGAQKWWTSALSMAKEKDVPQLQAKALCNLAAIMRANKKLGETASYYEQAAQLLTGADNSDVLAQVKLEQGSALADLGERDKALSAFRQADKLANETGNVAVEIRAAMGLGDVLIDLQRQSEALATLKKANELIGDEQSKQKVQCLIKLGSACADLGEYKEAKSDHEAAAKLACAISYPQGELLSLTELGYDELLRGSQENALNRFYAAVEYLKANLPKEERDKASLYSYIGMCYQAVGQTNAAVKYGQDAATIFEKLGDTVDEAMAFNDVGVACLDSRSFKDFDTYYKHAQELLASINEQSVKDKLASACLDYNYAQACLYDNRYADALPHFQKALAVYTDAGERNGQGRVLRGLGFAYLRLNDNQKAIDTYRKAAELADKQENYEAQWDCAVGLGKALRACGRLKDAEAEFRKAVALVEKERRQMTRDSFKTFNMDWRQDCFLELADILASTNRVEEALEVTEKGRARAFLDLLEGRQHPRLPGDNVAQISTGPDEGSANQRPMLIASADLASAGTTRSVDVVPKASSLVEPTAISQFHSKAPDLQEILQLAKSSGGCFVEYCVLPDKILIWVLDSSGKVSMPPPVMITAKQLSEKVKTTFDSIVTPPKSMKELEQADKYRQTNLKDLYKILIEPTTPYLPKSPDTVVTFVPYGPLFRVPFAALVSADNHYFIEEHPVAYVPAIAVLRETEKLEQGVASQKNTLLAFGNPITKAIAFLGKLPYAEKEVQSVASLFTPGDALVEVGEKATKDEFRKMAPSRTVLHLATHGLIDEERPMNSAVVLAPQGTDDGLLTVRDILQLPQLHARLIVLSACQTGRGKITGDGVVGLSRAFIIAGTPSVLVSQWNVDDVMTEYQMKQLYIAYLKGTPKAPSLRQAQLKTIEFMEKSFPTLASGNDKVRANPRYWAAFQLIGEAR